MHPGVVAARTPDKPALVMASTGLQVSYRELDERSVRLARVFRAHGLRPGEAVAMWTENNPRYYEVYWAALRSGLYFVGVNRYATAQEAGYILRDSGARVLITSAAMAERASDLLDEIPDCPRRLMMDGAVPGFDVYEDVLAASSAEPLTDQPRGEVMLYSSGTTGRPKGIRRPLSGRQVDDPDAVRPSKLGRALLGLDEDTVYLSPSPLYHMAALQWSVGVQEVGGTVVVMEKFDAEGLLRRVEEHRVSHVQVVPTMMVRMLKLPAEVRERYDVSSLRSFVHAAAPCPPDVKRAMIEWLGPVVQEYFAATEGIGMTWIDAEEWLAHPGSVGRAMLGTLHICDDDGAEVPTGEPGLVYFERDVATFRYHNDEAKTREAAHPQHPTWATTGDLGYVDADGYLYLTDRKGFMVISGGVNVYPAEVEACLVMHPAVADVAVFGLPHPDLGEYVHAVVEVVPGAAEGAGLADELVAYARERLSSYKVPKRVTFRAEIPRLATGKILKGPLREEYLVR